MQYLKKSELLSYFKPNDKKILHLSHGQCFVNHNNCGVGKPAHLIGPSVSRVLKAVKYGGPKLIQK